MPVDSELIPCACRRIHALADRNPRRAVALARHAHAMLHTSDQATVAWANSTLGWALLRWERASEARPYLEAAYTAFVLQEAHIAALRCRYALLLADQMQLSRANLDQEFALLAEQFVSAGALPNAVEATLDHARQLNMLGRSQEAVEALDRTAPIIMGGTTFDLARMLRIRGVAANGQGDFPGAQRLLWEAEQSFSTLKQPIEVAKCWLEQAWVALRQELLDTALEGYQRAERVFIRFDLPLQRAFCAKNYSLLRAKRGDYDLALRSSIAALHDFTTLQRTSDIGACQLHLGNLYFYLGHWEAALACYIRAETIYHQLGLIGYRLFARRNRAMIYRAQKRYGDLHTLLATLEDEARALGNQAEVAEIYALKAALLADQSNYAAAATCYQEAQALFIQLGNQHAIAECRLELAWLAVQQGAADQARQLLELAEPELRAHPHDHWRLLYGLARCAEIQGDSALALDRYQAALSIVATLRRRLVSEGISSSLYAQAAQLHIDSLHLAAAQSAHTLLLKLSELQRGLVLQRLLVSRTPAVLEAYAVEYESLRRQIASSLEYGADTTSLDDALAAYNDLLLRSRHSSSYQHEPATTQIPTIPELADLRACLTELYSQDWTVLIYVLEGDTLLIGELSADTLMFEPTPFDPALRLLITRASHQTYREYTYRDFPFVQGQADQPWAQLRALTNRLLTARIVRRLHPDHRLLIVPAGPLHALPWASLRLEAGWLVESAILQVVPSLTIWHMLANRPGMSGRSALFIGCGEFGERAPALPGIAAEQAALRRVYPLEHALIDSTAERAGLRAYSQRGELASHSVIHIASHAQLLPARGLGAHLKLWDSDLLLPEVAELRLGGGLVTLSACDGAAADVLPGEEVLSLSWAFLAAGASCVLSSLWPIYDRAVVQLMALFYAGLRESGDPAIALVHAQRALIAASAYGDPAAEPQHWASFVLTGYSHVPMATGGTAPPPS